MNSETAKQAGLAEAGKDEEGEQLYIGTQKQWDSVEIIEEDEMRTKDLLEEKIKHENEEEHE